MAHDRDRRRSKLTREFGTVGDRTWARAAAILAVLALTFALLLIGAFEPLEHRLTAVRAELLDRAPTGQVAIVEIDAKSLAAISTWPWSRGYHARVLQRLH